MYADFKYDIQPLNGVMIEKFIPPYFENELLAEWRDKNGYLHSRNGMPAFIRFKGDNAINILIWYNHGKYKKGVNLGQKLEHESIAEKIKMRKFVKIKRND